MTAPATHQASEQGGDGMSDVHHPDDTNPAAHQHGSGAGPGGHVGHSDHAALFRRRFWLSLALTIPVVVYSHMLMELTGWNPPGFSGDRWIPPVLGTAVFAYGGPVFLTAGWGELRRAGRG